mgnify:CR=1 FL=1
MQQVSSGDGLVHVPGKRFLSIGIFTSPGNYASLKLRSRNDTRVCIKIYCTNQQVESINEAWGLFERFKVLEFIFRTGYFPLEEAKGQYDLGGVNVVCFQNNSLTQVCFSRWNCVDGACTRIPDMEEKYREIKCGIRVGSTISIYFYYRNYSVNVALNLNIRVCLCL